MKKYHYTSKANADKILVEGLKTYPFHNSEILAVVEHLPDWDGMGSFLWDEKLNEVEELGSVLWQMLTKDTYMISQLEVEVEREDILYGDYGKVQMYHDQTFSPTYHPDAKMHDKTPASIGIRLINPDKIKLVKEYNVLDIVMGPMGPSSSGKTAASKPADGSSILSRPAAAQMPQ